MYVLRVDACRPVQLTSVLFKSSLTGVISNLDTSGWLPSAEILEKVNVMEFTSKYEVADSEYKPRENLLAIVPPSGTRKKLHSNQSPSATVHVNSS